MCFRSFIPGNDACDENIVKSVLSLTGSAWTAGVSRFYTVSRMKRITLVLSSSLIRWTVATSKHIPVQALKALRRLMDSTERGLCGRREQLEFCSSIFPRWCRMIDWGSHSSSDSTPMGKCFINDYIFLYKCCFWMQIACGRDVMRRGWRILPSVRCHCRWVTPATVAPMLPPTTWE